MGEDRVVQLASQNRIEDPLTEFAAREGRRAAARGGERRMRGVLERLAHRRDDHGRQAVVRNGYLPQRKVLTGVGAVPVRVPRVRDRTGGGVRFESRLVPAYVRRAKSVDAVLPWLYLRGIAQADVGQALAALVGRDAANLSAPVIGRLKASWAAEYAAWQKADLSRERWVYLWVDGIYSGIRAEGHRMCALVVVGVNERGQKRFLAIADGVRESKQSWREVLIGLKQRVLVAPSLAVGDGALGFWAALEEVFPEKRTQRCWVHKTANVLNYLPRSVQPKAKAGLQAIWMAETRQAAIKAFVVFMLTYEAKYPKATECLAKDRDALLPSTTSRPSTGFTSEPRT